MSAPHLYGHVAGDAVTDGPRTLPSSWRTDDAEILAFDRLDDPTPYGWWPWIEEDAPEFDTATQRLEPAIRIDAKAKRIVRGYAAVTLSPGEAAALDPVPDQISTRQFFQQLAKDGDCSEDEALAYVQIGKLPQVLLDAVATLPAAAQFDVKMELIGANDYYRSSPNVDTVGWLLGKDGEALNRIWRLASKL